MFASVRLYVCLLLVDLANLCLSLSVAESTMFVDCVYRHIVLSRRTIRIFLFWSEWKKRKVVLSKYVKTCVAANWPSAIVCGGSFAFVVHVPDAPDEVYFFEPKPRTVREVQSIAVWLVIVLSSVSPMSLLQPSLVASSGIPLHRGKWQHLPMFCLSVCLSIRLSVCCL